jgi:hypothetical protein
VQQWFVGLSCRRRTDGEQACVRPERRSHYARPVTSAGCIRAYGSRASPPLPSFPSLRSVPSEADLPRLAYAEAVFNEALRLYPPAHATNRDTDKGPFAVSQLLRATRALRCVAFHGRRHDIIPVQTRMSRESFFASPGGRRGHPEGCSRSPVHLLGAPKPRHLAAPRRLRTRALPAGRACAELAASFLAEHGTMSWAVLPTCQARVGLHVDSCSSQLCFRRGLGPVLRRRAQCPPLRGVPYRRSDALRRRSRPPQSSPLHEAVAARVPGAHAPFGFGSRMCVGWRFAVQVRDASGSRRGEHVGSARAVRRLLVLIRHLIRCVRVALQEGKVALAQLYQKLRFELEPGQVRAQ